MQLFVCCHLHHAALQHSKRSGWNRALHAPRSGENGRQVSRTLTGLQHSTRATFILQPYGDFGQHRAPDTVLCKPVSVGILLQVLHFLENFQSITINAGTHTCHRFSRVRLQYRLCELWAAVLSMCCIWFPWLNQSDDSSVAAAAARWVRPGAPCEASPSRARWSGGGGDGAASASCEIAAASTCSSWIFQEPAWPLLPPPCTHPTS